MIPKLPNLRLHPSLRLRLPRHLQTALRRAYRLLPGRSFWKGEFALFISVAVAVLFHLADAPREATITPFPLLPGFEIHPEPWLHMALWRVRVMVLYVVIYFAVPRLWLFVTVLFFLEFIDLIDYLLRYGQDYFRGVDANTAKVLACLLFGSVSLIKFIRQHENKG